MYRNTHETEEVETTVGLLGVLAALEDDLVLVERALLDRYIDPDDVLPDNTTSTDVQVSKPFMYEISHTSHCSRVIDGRTRPQSCP